MKRFLLAIGAAGLSSCANPGGQTYHDYPHSASDSLEVPGMICHMETSGGLLIVLFRDSLNQWKIGFYNTTDLSEIAMLAPGHNNLEFSDAVMGTGRFYISFAAASSDTCYMVMVDIPSHSLAGEFPLAGGADWGPMAMGPGAIYHLEDSTGKLYRMDILTGEVTETQSSLKPKGVGGMLYVQGYGLFATDRAGNVLYRIDEDGTLLNSWGVDRDPGKIAWDGYRVLLTSTPGICPVSPNTGKLPSVILANVGAITVSPDTELILAGYRDGVASVSVDNLEVLGTAPTPFPIDLVAAAGHAKAFATARGKSRIYLLE
jgi:hypothetical protein